VVDEAVVAVHGLKTQLRHQPVVEPDALLEAVGSQHGVCDAVDLHRASPQRMIDDTTI
jgi:hypothetical protein